MLALATLGGCLSNMIYLRTDGQNIAGDPALRQQFDLDHSFCQGKLQGANFSDVTFTQRGQAASQLVEGCMLERGYLLVREDQAAAKQQELAAIAAEKARREAAGAVPAPPPPPRRSAAVKSKPPQPISQPAPN